MTEVHNGRRPRRVVLVAAAAGLLVPLITVAVTSGLFDAKTSAAAQADNPTGCHTVPLPAPDGTTSEVTGGDPTGRYLVAT